MSSTENLTPAEIVIELDKFIVGQKNAKRAVAIALRNRHRRRMLDDDMRDEVIPKNILMIGPTGVGKTEIARRLAKLAHAPFIKVEATKFTEVGYVGRDVDSMVRDLAMASFRMVEEERLAEVKAEADELAIERVLDVLFPEEVGETPLAAESANADNIAKSLSMLLGARVIGKVTAVGGETAPHQAEPRERSEQENEMRAEFRRAILAGEKDNVKVSIEVEPTATPHVQIMGAHSMEELNDNLQSMFGRMGGRQAKERKVTIAEARRLFAREEAKKLIDSDAVTQEAVKRAEQSGIIFIDEMDKVAGRQGRSGADVSREGVQRDLLPIIEGSSVNTKIGPVDTSHVLFIAAGAFHDARPSDLIPELQGRLPIRVELDNLTENDFYRILTEPKNALIKQYVALMGTEDVEITFEDEAIKEICGIAARVNDRNENIGARRLHTVMERLLEEISFEAPSIAPTSITITAGYVREKLEGIARNDDLSRYIL